MVKKPTRVVWDKHAYAALQKAYDHIKEDTPSAAEKVREGILKIARSLSARPEKYPPDKLKTDNPGNFRAFEKYSYRVAYKVTEDKIVILRVRHVKQEPKEH
jgi:plasmid stabilization system protein ParE